MTEGREETIDGGVILRFPGDWVGPLEELVPFGPSADRESSSGAPDFWGEDSAVLQDAVEVAEAVQKPPPPRRPPREPLPLRRWLLPAGAVLAVVLFGVAALLGANRSTAPGVHAVPFAAASIPPLAPTTAAVQHPPTRHHRTVTRSRSHQKTPPAAVTSGTTSSQVSTTPSPTYHPAAATSSNAGTSSQGGGAFTLGGP